MNTRSLLMLLAVVLVGIAALPAQSVCGDISALAAYVNSTDDDCPNPCYGPENHWHIRFTYYSSHTYSNWRAEGDTMSGAGWGPSGGYYYFSPNKSGAFGSNCLSWNPCWRCTYGNSCSLSDLKVNVCH